MDSGAQVREDVQSLDCRQNEEPDKTGSDHEYFTASSMSSFSENEELFKIDFGDIQYKKTKESKTKLPKPPKFNKLLDFPSLLQEITPSEIESLRDAPLEFELDTKNVKKKEFFSGIETREKEQSTYSLAKSVLTNKDSQDTLVVSTPLSMQGFTRKTVINNPRDLFRDKLKSVINERKTNHIKQDKIFDKTVSDFDKKNSESHKDHDEIKETLQEFSYQQTAGIKKLAQIPKNAENPLNISYPSTSSCSPIYDPDLNPRPLEDDQRLAANLNEDPRELEYRTQITRLFSNPSGELNLKRENHDDSSIAHKKIRVNGQMGSMLDVEDEESDEEKQIKKLRDFRSIRSIRNLEEKAEIISSKDFDTLRLMERPKQLVTVKTLLNCANVKVSGEGNAAKNPFFKITKTENPEQKKELKVMNKSKRKLLNYVKN